MIGKTYLKKFADEIYFFLCPVSFDRDNEI